MKAKIFTNDFNRIIAATKGFVSKDDVKMVLPVRIKNQ